MSKNPIRWAIDWGDQTREYLGEVQVEFKKVTWPTQQETIAGTISVMVLVVVVAIGLFGVDSVLAWLMTLLP